MHLKQIKNETNNTFFDVHTGRYLFTSGQGSHHDIMGGLTVGGAIKGFQGRVNAAYLGLGATLLW